VPATAISVIGRGEDDLLVPTDDGVREPQNRRTVIVLGDPGQVSQVGIAPRRNPRRSVGGDGRMREGSLFRGISVLEDGLIKDKIPLPSPGYRWPGKS